MGSASSKSLTKSQDKEGFPDNEDPPGLLDEEKISLLQRFKLGAGKEFFEEFPSLELLRHSQKVFSLQSYPIPSHGGAPVPYPSSGHREDLFNQADLGAIDKHVRKVRPDLCFKDLPEVVAQITKTACNDVERVAAIFRWITTLDLSALGLIGHYDNKTAAYYLYNILTGTGVYPQLLGQLCRFINIPCVTIRGWVKGSGYEPGDRLDKPSATWSAVFIGGNWWLLDCHWSSVHFTMRGKSKDKEQPRNQISGNETGPTTHNKGSNIVTKGQPHNDNGPNTATFGIDGEDSSVTFDDTYFLLDPWTMIYSHCPVEVEWQLLARPVTMEEFIELPCIEPLFIELGFTTSKRAKGVLQCTEGKTTISLGMPSKCTFRLSHRLTRKTKSSCETHFGKIPLEQFVFLNMDYKKLCSEIEFGLPDKGNYKYEFFCEDPKGKVFNLIATYKIQNEKSGTVASPYPSNTRIEWGPGRDMMDMGISPVTHTSGRIIANGQYTVVKFRTKHKTKFNHNLLGGQNMKSNFHDFAFYEVQKDFVVYRIRIPELGRFILKLYARKQDATSLEYHCVCSYLVECNTPPKDKLLPFLESLSRNSAGSTEHFRHFGLKFVSEEKGYFETKFGELNLKLQIPSKLRLKSELCFGHKEENSNQHSKFKIKGDAATYHLEFPYVGMYRFSILSKTEGDENQFKPVYHALIEATLPKIGALPFPETLSGWKPSYEVVKPLYGLIVANKTIQIQVNVPDATTVTVDSSPPIKLTKNRIGTWSAAFPTGSKDTKICVCATFKATGDENIPLVSYEVVTSGEIDRIIQEQKSASDRLKQTQGKER